MSTPEAEPQIEVEPDEEEEYEAPPFVEPQARTLKRLGLDVDS